MIAPCVTTVLIDWTALLVPMGTHVILVLQKNGLIQLMKTVISIKLIAAKINTGIRLIMYVINATKPVMNVMDHLKTIALRSKRIALTVCS